jgi:hypothetical protein
MADVEDVLAAEENLRKGITSQNWDAVEKLLSPNLVYTHATAKVQNKGEYLETLSKMSHRFGCKRMRAQVKVYGDTAVMTGRQVNETVGLGVTYHQVIQVWHKETGAWLLVAQQSTRLPEPDPDMPKEGPIGL